MKRAVLCLLMWLCLSLTAVSCHKPSPESKSVMTRLGDGGQDLAIVRWMDVTTPLQVATLLAVTRHFDAKLIPDGGWPSTYANGTQAPSQFNTLHETRPIPNCLNQGEWAIPFTLTDATEWAALKIACVHAVDAGATGPCVQIAAMPSLVTSLPASWANDGSVVLCWWEEDGGGTPLPPDNYDGSTP